MQAWKNKELYRPSVALITQNSFFEVKAVNGWAYLEQYLVFSRAPSWLSPESHFDLVC